MITDPASVSKEDLPETLLTPEERCHVAIIVMETKKRIELIYFTQALSRLIGL